MHASSRTVKTYSSTYNQGVINSKKKCPSNPKYGAAYTGLRPKEAHQWALGPDKYINGLLEQTLNDVAAVQTANALVPLSTRDRIKLVTQAGMWAYSASFLPAKFVVNLFGFLATLSPEHARKLFIAGAAGYNLTASLLNPTSTQIMAGGRLIAFGGAQPPDNAAWGNFITLLGMRLVAQADDDHEQVAVCESALQEIRDSVLARAQAEADKGTPLSFDDRDNPIWGAARRTWGWHASFFSFSLMYLVAGGLAPVERLCFMNMPGSTALRSGLYNLTDLLVWIVCGEIAGILTMAGQLWTNAKVQHGAEKPGLHQSWPEELLASQEKLNGIVLSHTKLIGIRNSIQRNIRASRVSDEEKRRRLQAVKEQVLPLLDAAIDRVARLQTKYERRSRLLTTEAGRNELASDKVAATVLKGAGKTPHKVINQSPGALQRRVGGLMLGNMLSLALLSYAIFELYLQFSNTMPFREHENTAVVGSAFNNTDLWNNATAADFNGAHAEPHIPMDTQAYSTLLGVVLILCFNTRAAFIPMMELLLSALCAGGLWGARQVGLRGTDKPAEPGSTDDDGPPPPDYRPDAPPVEPQDMEMPVSMDHRADEELVEVVDEAPPSEDGGEAGRTPPPEDDAHLLSSVMNLETLIDYLSDPNV